MTGRVWLASYPKSGNTWMRLLIGALTLPPGAALDLNTSIYREGIASSRRRFESATLLDSGLLTFDEIDRLRPRVYQSPPEDDDGTEDEPRLAGVRFIKVHDAYLTSSDGAPLLGGGEACPRAIVIVRDPRDVAPSLASHNGGSIDDAIELMADPNGEYAARLDRQADQLRQRLSSWGGHIESWLQQREVEIHLVRYEDLARSTAEGLRRAMAFAGVEISMEAAVRAAEATAFATVQALEVQTGFAERPKKARAFFRRGQVGGWRDELTPEQAARIESTQGAVMDRLGYARSRRP